MRDALPLGERGGQQDLGSRIGSQTRWHGVRPAEEGRGRPPLVAAGITCLSQSQSSSVRSLGYVVSFIYPYYTTHEDFSDRFSGQPGSREARGFRVDEADGYALLEGKTFTSFILWRSLYNATV